jgi:hypothetical protein
LEAIVGQTFTEFDPVASSPSKISPHDAVAAAGSCFAQHIAKYLVASGFNYIREESSQNPDEPVFSARYGNIYTVRQLSQLLRRAYGLHRPVDSAWLRNDGRFVDPFRPQLFPNGFETGDAVKAARLQHLKAVRSVFEKCDFFIFALGLTESWLAEDGTALLVPPGVVAEQADGTYTFHNFTVAEMCDDMNEFLGSLSKVNPRVRVILTVSPVPLVATFENRHVLVSNTYSKSALRVVAEETIRKHAHVSYFPSYELITSPVARFDYFEADLRSVSNTGVSRVMELFSQHFLSDASQNQTLSATNKKPPSDIVIDQETMRRFESIHQIICDEELLDQESTGEGRRSL